MGLALYLLRSAPVKGGRRHGLPAWIEGGWLGHRFGSRTSGRRRSHLGGWSEGLVYRTASELEWMMEGFKQHAYPELALALACGIRGRIVHLRQFRERKAISLVSLLRKHQQ